MSQLPAPKAVSPLIRASRWGMLIAGVLYGHYHLNSLTQRELPVLERENKIREEKRRKRLVEKAREDREELLSLGEAVGMTPAEIETNFFGGKAKTENAHASHH